MSSSADADKVSPAVAADAPRNCGVGRDDDDEKGRSPASDSAESVVRVESDAQDLDENRSNNNGESDLPFSKGRCVALVVTVTGAAFLNASLGLESQTWTRDDQRVRIPG
jgi:hypothetical protein